VSGILIVPQADVPRLLPIGACIEAMEAVFRQLALGRAILPLRQVMWLPGQAAALAAMPAFLEEPRALGLKAIGYFPSNQGTPEDSHQGAVLLFEPDRGRILAIIDATAITAIRTAAVSGLATRVLAREDAGDLAILGSSVQARTHLEAMLLARRIRRVRVASRRFENARRFAARESRRHGIEVEPVERARDAVAGADIICTVTSSKEPVLLGNWISAGAHINAVGSSIPGARELDTAAVVGSRLYVDRRESALGEAGDLLGPIREGAIGENHIRGELGEVLLGRIPGRESPEDVTLFESLGLAVEDLAAAHAVYLRATAEGAGHSVALGGNREEDGEDEE
jgi:ornithine cyclodeaminase/alanine dehydrogenase-like protein (mu-crystallin family)